MDNTIELFITMGGFLVFLVLSMLLAMKLYEYRITRQLSNMSKAELKRWVRYRKYHKSHAGPQKSVAIVIGVVTLFMLSGLIGVVFPGSDKFIRLSTAILFIPLIVLTARSVFKTRNRDGMTAFIFVLIMLIGMALHGFGVTYGLSIMQIGFWIFVGWTLLTRSGEREAVTLYNNLIVTAGVEVDSQLNGYSQRPYSEESDILKNKSNLNFMEIAGDFGKTMGKELIFMDWKIKDNEAVFYPVTANLLIAQLYSMFPSLGKDKISWIKLSSDGRITVFVSKDDYGRILTPVTYHTLCRIIAEKFEQSFIEFTNGWGNNGHNKNKINSIKILRGEQK